MRKFALSALLTITGFVLIVTVACKEKNKVPGKDEIASLYLKRGDIIACGPPEKQLGTVYFTTSCSEATKKDFDLALALLHSFEYDEAEKAFVKVIDQEPGCAIAWWGIAMSNYHPLWTPPSQAELQKGAKAIAIAQSLPKKSKKESAYIDALALFYKDWETTNHRTRSIAFSNAMEQIYNEYKEDKEAAIFYALALTATADPADKTFVSQKKAGAILDELYKSEPNHPGVVHYIIHAYDYPELAELGLTAARQYASVAPSSAHALHMPSHIFTRLGLWNECILSNFNSVASARCYAEAAGLKGHWDEELHGLDYLMYAYLQIGDQKEAKKQWDYLRSIDRVDPVNFKVAYAFAAIPSRYLLENKMWDEASKLEYDNKVVPWKNYPWQEAMLRYTKLMGAAQLSHLDAAKTELRALEIIHDTLINQKDTYKATQVEIELKAGKAWILFKEGDSAQALQLMTEAADLEDKTEKHPVTPGAIIPAREQLGDMLIQMRRPAEALVAYEADLKRQPNRFNALYGAATAAKALGDDTKADEYFRLLKNFHK